MPDQIKTLSLDKERIPKLLFRYAAPAIISMTAASLFNLADVIFIGRGVNAMAIAGLFLTLPLMNISAAFGSLIGVGASTLISVKLGQKDIQTAEVALGNAVTLNTIIGIIYTIVALIFLDSVLYFFGASEQTVPYAREYMQIILGGNVITHIYYGLNDNLRASGYPKKAMAATLTAVGINIILDPLFIFGFRWGIRGAAVATVLAQVVALIILLNHYSSKQSLLHFKKGIFIIQKGMPRNIISVGLAPFLMNIVSSLVIIIINRSFFHFGGDYAVGAYGIANRMISFFVMIMFGFNQGMQPLVGFNYGARQYKRVSEIFKLTLLCSFGVSVLAFIIAQFFPVAAVSLFTNDPTLARLTVEGLHIDLAVFPLVSLSMVTSSFFQSIRKPGKAIFLSLTRQVIFLIPSLLILPRFFGVTGVWASMPVSDAASFVVAAILITKQMKEFRKDYERYR
ncbi:MAG: MATE family efflux transporter [Bacteroidales bacterium]|nr:MATE family efflux transporter [Bacteroidales bacterium]MDD4029864.1 MATE family efflux transporter [Bacteroidales bacterium]MDD4434944.1 MATE family efflux transporter [Bacteroidales bacterium]